MLDLVEVALNMNGFKFVRVDGSRSDEQRKTSLETFRTDHQYNILLASIGSAGVGYSHRLPLGPIPAHLYSIYTLTDRC